MASASRCVSNDVFTGICAAISSQPNLHRHGFHAALVVALVGALGSLMNVVKIGQLFAGKPVDTDVPTGPQSKTWDGMSYGPEVGTYHAKLNFVVAGQWAVAIRFQRDSIHPLERIDWMQDVLDERPSKTP